MRLEYFRDLPKAEEENQEDFFDVMKWRLKHDRSNIVIIVGEQGSGKSNTGLYLAWKCNRLFYKKDFDFDKHIYHSILKFTKALPNIRNSFVLLEECGVELNSKSWRESQNRVFRDIIETFRIYGISLILTLPNLVDLDKSSRFLSHFLIRMNYPSNAIIFRKWTSFLTDKLKFKAFSDWYDIPDMRKKSPILWKQYEEWHEKYMTEKRTDWIDQIELKDLKKSYKKQWYKQRTTGFEVLAVKSQ